VQNFPVHGQTGTLHTLRFVQAAHAGVIRKECELPVAFVIGRQKERESKDRLDGWQLRNTCATKENRGCSCRWVTALNEVARAHHRLLHRRKADVGGEAARQTGAHLLIEELSWRRSTSTPS
jgi:hypothetical protein